MSLSKQVLYYTRQRSSYFHLESQASIVHARSGLGLLLGFAIEDTFHYEAYFTSLNKQCGLREARVIISSLFERALSGHVYSLHDACLGRKSRKKDNANNSGVGGGRW